MKERRMREAEMSEPVQRWLAFDGFMTYAEVPYNGHRLDIVGRNGERLCIVEMKCGLNETVLYQASIARLYASEVWIAVKAKPRSLVRCEQLGVGLVHVTDRVNTLLDPVPPFVPHGPSVAGLHKRLDELEPGGIAGLPVLAGSGPAQDCAKRIKEYLSVNPRATWKDIYRDVPNHYAHVRSMRSALDRFALEVA